MIEFTIIRERSRAIKSNAALGFRRAKSVLIKDLLGAILWAKTLESKGAQESWLMISFKLKIGTFLCVKDQVEEEGDL